MKHSNILFLTIFVIVLSVVPVGNLFSQTGEIIQQRIITDELNNQSLRVIINAKNLSNTAITEYTFTEKTDIQLGKPSNSGISRQIQIINGNRTESITTSVTFPLQITKQGTYIIPPVKFKLGGQTFITERMKARLTKGVQAILSSIKASKYSVYPYEPVRIELEIYVLGLTGFYISGGYIESESINKLGKENFDPQKINNHKNKMTVRISDFDKTLDMEYIGSRKIDGMAYYVFKGAFTIYPSGIQRFTLEPMSFTVVYSESGFMADQRAFGTNTKAVDIILKDFPDEQKPNYFSGAVGDYSITSRIDKSEARIGEPILLEVIISGSGKVGNIDRINLGNIEGFKNNFKLTKENSPGEVVDNSIIYKYTIRVTNENIKYIPEIPFSFFNINTESYKTVYSNKIPVNIIESDVVSEEDIISGNDKTSGGNDKEEIEISSGILSNYNGSGLLKDTRINLVNYLWVFIFPFIYLILFIVMRNKRVMEVNKAYRRNKLAKKNAFESIKSLSQITDSKGFYEKLNYVLVKYISDKFNLGEGELTTEELNDIFDNYKFQEKDKNEVITNITKIMSECELYRFASVGSSELNNRENIIQKLKSVINTVEKIKK